MTDAGRRLIEACRRAGTCELSATDVIAIHEAADEIERLRGVEAAVEKLLEWVGPLAGDNCDPISAEIEVRTVAEVRAAIAASRSTGAADVGEEALTDSQGRDLTNAPEEYRREASGERDR